MATSGRKPAAAAARHATRSGLQPASKWAVVAAVIFAVMLHAGAVVWVEMQQETPPFEVGAPVLIQPMEEAFETGAGTDVAGADGRKTAVD